MKSYHELHEMEMKYSDGGKVSMVQGALKAIEAAMQHLEGGNPTAAATVLHSSPEAMQHPQVQQVAKMLHPTTGQPEQMLMQPGFLTKPQGMAKGGSATGKAAPTDIVAHLADTMEAHPELAPVLQAHAMALLRANLAAAHAIHSATGDLGGYGHYAQAASTLAGALGSGAPGQNDAATQQMVAQILQGSGSSPQAVGPAAMQAARMAVPQQQPVALGQGQVPIQQPTLPDAQSG